MSASHASDSDPAAEIKQQVAVVDKRANAAARLTELEALNSTPRRQPGAADLWRSVPRALGERLSAARAWDKANPSVMRGLQS